jgi:hypothetical protein
LRVPTGRADSRHRVEIDRRIEQPGLRNRTSESGSAPVEDLHRDIAGIGFFATDRLDDSTTMRGSWKSSFSLSDLP